jgi:hypothetical protein
MNKDSNIPKSDTKEIIKEDDSAHGVYISEVGNNVHLRDNKFPHDFSKKIDVEKQNKIDLNIKDDKYNKER